MTTKNWRLWPPTGETIEALASSLSSHWAAAKSRPAELFWPKRASWLRQQATRLVDGASSSAPDSDVLIG